jgi:hypothetical protein
MSKVVRYPAPEPQIEDISRRLLREAVPNPSPVLEDLVRRGFEQKLAELYEILQQGECSLGYLAEQLDISYWEAARLLGGTGIAYNKPVICPSQRCATPGLRNPSGTGTSLR